MPLVQDRDSFEREPPLLHFLRNIRVKHDVLGFLPKIAYDNTQVPPLDQATPCKCESIGKHA